MSNTDDMGDLGNFKENPADKKDKAESEMDDMGALGKFIDPAEQPKRARATVAEPLPNPPPATGVPGAPALPAVPAAAAATAAAAEDLSELGRFAEDPGDAIKPIEISGAVPTDFLPKGPGRDEPKPATRRLADGTEVPADVAKHVFDDEKNKLKKDDYVDLIHKIPSLKQIYVACGWTQVMLETDRVDVDMSLFLLDKTGQTRIDNDFLFYNNQRACDGAVKHLGDNRSGMGDGDNETIFVDFNGIPFDVLKLMVAITIYDEKRDGLHFGGVQNLYVRLVNKEDNFEVLRMAIPDDVVRDHNTLVPFVLIREGPKWFCEALEKTGKEGLMGIAKSVGIIIQEDTG
jgi:tellurium resistance protein TerD